MMVPPTPSSRWWLAPPSPKRSSSKRHDTGPEGGDRTSRQGGLHLSQGGRRNAACLAAWHRIGGVRVRRPVGGPVETSLRRRLGCARIRRGAFPPPPHAPCPRRLPGAGAAFSPPPP